MHIAMEPFLAVLQGQKTLADFDYLNTSAVSMLDDLAWWTRALKQAREQDQKAAAAA